VPPQLGSAIPEQKRYGRSAISGGARPPTHLPQQQGCSRRQPRGERRALGPCRAEMAEGRPTRRQQQKHSVNSKAAVQDLVVKSESKAHGSLPRGEVSKNLGVVLG